MARNAFVINLTDFISNARQNILDAKTSSRAKKITEFNQRVVNEGLGLDAQLAFWNKQKDMDETSQFPTPDFIKEAGDQVVTLNSQIRVKAYRDTYQSKLSSIEQNKDNYDNLKVWLEGQLASAVDPGLKDEITTSLSGPEGVYSKISQATKDALDNQITRGQNDRSLTVLSEAKNKIDAKIAEAMASGKNDDEQYWKGKLTVVQQSTNTVRAENAINDFRVGKIQGIGAVQLLGKLNTAVSNVQADDIPIYVDAGNGSVRYDNLHAFLQSSRDSYLSDTGPTGFFGQIQKENEDFIDRAVNIAGSVPTATLDSIQRAVDTLKTKPELQPFLNQLDNLKVDLLKRGVDKNVNTIVSHFTADLNFSKAASDITKLANRYGLDQSTTMDALVNAMADKRQQIIDNIVGTAAQIQGDHPGMQWQDAVNQAEQYFRGGIVSPNQAVEQSIHSLALAAANPKNAKLPGAKIPAQSNTPPAASTYGRYLTPDEAKSGKFSGDTVTIPGSGIRFKSPEAEKKATGTISQPKTTGSATPTTTVGTAPIVSQVNESTPAVTAGSAPAPVAKPVSTTTAPPAPNVVGHEPVVTPPPAGAYHIQDPKALPNFTENDLVRNSGNIYLKAETYNARHIAKPSDLSKYKPTDYFSIGNDKFLKSGVVKK